MTNEIFRCSLEPSGDGREYSVCPKCGKKRYTRFVDNQTGQYLPYEFGRCERINSCGYMKSPKNNNNESNNYKMAKDFEPKEVVSEIASERIENKSFMLSSVNDFMNSALLFFLYLVWGEKAVEVFNLYEVMVAKHYYKDGKFGTAFLQMDREGKIRQVKVMAYNPKTGKRLKGNDEFLIYNRRTHRYEKNKPETPASMYIGKILMYDKEFINKQCLFGVHLLNKFPDKPVAIVESEKTALICAIQMPEYVWLATGGQFGCKWTSSEVYNDLRGREVILFPDLKATEDWKIRAEDLAMDGINISVYEGLEEQATAEERDRGLDIADYILMAEKEVKPEAFDIKIEKPTPVVKKAEIPGLANLFKGSNQPKKQEPLDVDSEFAKQIQSILPTQEEVEGLKNPQKIKPNSQEELTISWKEEDDDVTADIR